MEDRFEEFWGIYPRRVAKGAAQRAWKKALRRAEVEDILKGAFAYRNDPHRLSRALEYTAHPATWLNADRWLDEVGSSVPEVEPVDLARRFDDVPVGISLAEWREQHAG
jgi:hypothetical protein